jgi:hypothetical protein
MSRVSIRIIMSQLIQNRRGGVLRQELQGHGELDLVLELTRRSDRDLEEGDESAIALAAASLRHVRPNGHGGTPHLGRETEMLSGWKALRGAVDRAGDVSRAV